MGRSAERDKKWVDATAQCCVATFLKVGGEGGLSKMLPKIRVVDGGGLRTRMAKNIDQSSGGSTLQVCAVRSRCLAR